jgi:hypothetical protein
MRRFRPLVPARHAPRLRPRPLLVRAMLVSRSETVEAALSRQRPQPGLPTVSRTPENPTIQKEDLMRKITMTLAAAIFVVGSMTVANAQTQGASSLNAQAQNATIIHKAACGGVWGRWCPPGRHRVCGPYRCWCAPCW